MLRTSRLVLLGLIIMLAAACTSSATVPNLAGTQWKLATLNGQAPITSSRIIILNFDPNNQISGNSGCNSYGGNFATSGSTLSFSKVFMTLMACPEPGIDEQESAFQQALSKVASFEISNGQLNLKDASGAVVLTFSKA